MCWVYCSPLVGFRPFLYKDVLPMRSYTPALGPADRLPSLTATGSGGITQDPFATRSRGDRATGGPEYHIMCLFMPRHGTPRPKYHNLYPATSGTGRGDLDLGRTSWSMPGYRSGGPSGPHSSWLVMWKGPSWWGAQRNRLFGPLCSSHTPQQPGCWGVWHHWRPRPRRELRYGLRPQFVA